MGIVTLNPGGEIIYANQQAEQLLGLSKSEFINGRYPAPTWKVTDFKGHPFPDSELPFAGIMQSQAPVYEVEQALAWPDGRRVYLSINATPMHSPEGISEGVTATLQDVSERVRMEQQLRQSEQRYQDLFNNLMDEVHVWKVQRDERGRIHNWTLVDANGASLNNWGQTLEAVVGKTATEIFGPEALDLFRPIVERIFEMGQAYRWESYFPPTQQYLSMDSIPLGEYFISTGRDITNTHEYEKELTLAKEQAEQAREKSQRSELRLKKTHSMAKLGGWEFDVPSGLFSFNDNFYEIFRSSVDRIGGYVMSPQEYAQRFVHPEDRAVVGMEIEKALKTDDPDFSAYLEHRMLYEDGEVGYIAVTYFIIKDEEGNTVTLYGVNQDITGRKQIEQELIQAKEAAEANEARYSGLLNNLETGVVVHAPDTSILMSNPRATVLLGLSELEMRGKTVHDPGWHFVDEDGSPLSVEDYPVMHILNTRTAMKTQIMGVHHPQKDLVWLLVSGIPVTNAAGEIIEVIVSFLDVTDRKLAEEVLRAAKDQAEESDRLKTAFLQNISHEIRTPLNALCGFAQLLDEPNLPPETRDEYVSLIQSSSDQLLSIVSDVLAISSLETGQETVNLKPVNVNALLKELSSIFEEKARSKYLTFRLSQTLPPETAEIITDETKLRQIISNLIGNALKFTDGGKVEFGCQREGDQLKFFVSDTGIGIPPEARERIFERFQQAHEDIAVQYGGTGLGLSISREYARLLGGRLWLDSELHRGSTFYCTIAYRPASPRPVKITTAPPPTSRTEQQYTVLVAEDQLLNAKVIEGMLRHLPVTLIHARDGQQALDLFQTHPEICLVLMDIKMPHMAGDEAAKAIKAINPNIPIIAQSGYALVQEKEKYAGLFDAYLTKPINGHALEQQVLKYMKLQEEE